MVEHSLYLKEGCGSLLKLENDKIQSLSVVSQLGNEVWGQSHFRMWSRPPPTWVTSCEWGILSYDYTEDFKLYHGHKKYMKKLSNILWGMTRKGLLEYYLVPQHYHKVSTSWIHDSLTYNHLVSSGDKSVGWQLESNTHHSSVSPDVCSKVPFTPWLINYMGGKVSGTELTWKEVPDWFMDTKPDLLSWALFLSISPIEESNLSRLIRDYVANKEQYRIRLGYPYLTPHIVREACELSSFMQYSDYYCLLDVVADIWDSHDCVLELELHSSPSEYIDGDMHATKILTKSDLMHWLSYFLCPVWYYTYSSRPAYLIKVKGVPRAVYIPFSNFSLTGYKSRRMKEFVERIDKDYSVYLNRRGG